MTPPDLDLALDALVGIMMLVAVFFIAWVWFNWDKVDGSRPPDRFEDPEL